MYIVYKKRSRFMYFKTDNKSFCNKSIRKIYYKPSERKNKN